MTIEQDAAVLADPKAYKDPKHVYEIMARLRREKPVCKIDIPGVDPIWLVSRHEDIKHIESNSKIFHAEPRPAVRSVEEEQEAAAQNDRSQTLVEMDGELHIKYRHIAQSWFMPKNLATLDAAIRSAAKRYVDLMENQAPSCDFAYDVAFWFPLRIVLSLAGVPEEADELVVKLTQNMFAPSDDDLLMEERLTSTQATEQIFALLMPLIEERKANPTDDLTSVIVHAEVDGRPLELPEILAYLLVVVTAGHDTTSASLAGGLLALLEHPDQLQRLIDKPELIPSAAEEIIRWVAPVKHFARTAMEDTEVGGVPIPKGDSLMLLFASACRDQSLFPDGDVFRVDRSPNQHMAFGYGPHVCMGRYLAKMEIEAFLAELLPRLESIELNGDPKYLAAILVSGLKSLPVKYKFKQA